LCPFGDPFQCSGLFGNFPSRVLSIFFPSTSLTFAHSFFPMLAPRDGMVLIASDFSRRVFICLVSCLLFLVSFFSVFDPSYAPSSFFRWWPTGFSLPPFIGPASCFFPSPRLSLGEFWIHHPAVRSLSGSTSVYRRRPGKRKIPRRFLNPTGEFF